MAENFRSATPDAQWSSASNSNSNSNSNSTGANNDDASGVNGEVGRTVLIGLLGGLVSAAGYLVYKRLPDEQRDRLHQQVRGMVQQRITELRQNFNL